jgi:opacity protein-like surface antigen
MKIRRTMKLIYLSAICINLGLAKISLAEESGNAEKKDGSVYVKAFGGLNFLRNADLESGGSSPLPEGEASFDAGLNVGLAVGYNLLEELALELEYSYRNNDIDKIKGQSGNFAKSGDLASVAIMANVLYSPNVSKSFSPYIGGGVGILQEIDSDVEFTNNDSVRDLEDSTIALQLIAGVEVPIADSLAVFGEGRYLGAPGPELSNNSQSYDFDYNSFSANLGLKYTF